MSTVKYKKVVVPVGDENGLLKWCVGLVLGDRDPALLSHQGQLIVFDELEEAQNYINEEE